MNKKQQKLRDQRRRARRIRTRLKALWNGIGFAWKLVVGLTVALAILGAYTFKPLLSVEEKDNSLDPADVTRTPFIIKNNGTFPIYRLSVSCGEGRTVPTDPQNRALSEDNIVFNLKYIGELDSGARAEMYCDSLISGIGGGLRASEITVYADFKTFWCPPHQIWAFPFKARKDAHGEQHWEPQGVDRNAHLPTLP